MSKSGALDLASGVGGKLQKKQVLSTVQRYLPFLVENAYALFLVFIPRVRVLFLLGSVLKSSGECKCLQILLFFEAPIIV